jgi:transposase
LKSQGLEQREICRLAGVSSNTLRQYLRLFQAGGIRKLQELNVYAPISKLERHLCQLETHFREYPPATLNEAAARIQELTGLKRSPSAVGTFLNSLGMAPRRVGTISSKADPEKQEHFRINELEPRFDEARQGKHAVFGRCCSLCLGCLSRYSLVVLPSLCKNLRRAEALQRARGIECDHARAGHGHKRHLHHGGQCLRPVAAHCEAESPRAHHAGVGQCPLSEMQHRDRIGFTAQYRAAVSPRLFTELEYHREALEIRQEKGSLLEILRDFLRLPKCNYRLP